MRSAIPVFLFFFFLAAAAKESNPIHLEPATNRLRAFIWNCKSWRLASEVNNMYKWTVVPSQCIDYVRTYMVSENEASSQYASDCFEVVQEALDYIGPLKPSDKDTWLFDLTDTLLSTVDYYSKADWGAWPFNRAAFDEWFQTADLPPVPSILNLYYVAKGKGFKIVIISGSSESNRALWEEKLKNAGFSNWDKLILKNETISSKEFKEKQREQLLTDGYKVIGNVGDQWADIVGGENVGVKTYKIPNPMYYVN